MRRTFSLFAVLSLLSTGLILPASAGAQPRAGTAPAVTKTYAALVDLVLASPAIVRGSIAKSQRISARNAPDLAPGLARLLITLDVEAVLIAPAAVPPQLTWLLDVPLDERGPVPALRGNRVLASIEAPQIDGKTRLIGPASQYLWSEDLEVRVRAIASDVKTADVAVVTGVTNGFRVEGTLPGESESQFFLSTLSGKPLTLVALERPGQSLQISVASSDIIDESATSVKPETLLWYRLACGLPAQLPVAAGGNEVALANAWIGAMTGLGPCVR